MDESEDDILLPAEVANPKKRWGWYKPETELNLIYDELKLKCSKKVLDPWLKRIVRSNITREEKLRQLYQERQGLRAKMDHIKRLSSDVYWHYKGFTEPEAKGKRARIRFKRKQQIMAPLKAMDKITCEIALLNAEERYEANMNRNNIGSPALQTQRQSQPIPIRIAEQAMNLHRPNNGNLQSPYNFRAPIILPSLPTNPYSSPFLVRNNLPSLPRFASSLLSPQPSTSKQHTPPPPPYPFHRETPPRPYTPYLDAPRRPSPPPSQTNQSAKDSSSPIPIDEMCQNLEKEATVQQQTDTNETSNKEQTEKVVNEQVNQQPSGDDEAARQRKEKAILIFAMRQHLTNVSKLHTKIGEEMLHFSKNWTALFKLPE